MLNLEVVEHLVTQQVLLVPVVGLQDHKQVVVQRATVQQEQQEAQLPLDFSV
jgi:hypothetical protein